MNEYQNKRFKIINDFTANATSEPLEALAIIKGEPT